MTPADVSTPIMCFFLVNMTRSTSATHPSRFSDECSSECRRRCEKEFSAPLFNNISVLSLLSLVWVRCYHLSDNRLMSDNSDNTGPHSWWYQVMDNQPTNPGPLPSQAIFFQFNIRESADVCQAAKTSDLQIQVTIRLGMGIKCAAMQ